MRWFDYLIAITIITILSLLAVIGFVGPDSFNGMGGLAFMTVIAVALIANNISWRFKIIDVEKDDNRMAAPLNAK